ncbi:MAG: LysR family transcriptional regulator [Atopobiaceae bacterium]
MYNHQLDTFVCVAESGSFMRAAQRLYISPAAVAKQMNLLEAHLGVKLFNRSHAGLTLTRAGQSFLQDSRHVISYSKDAIARAQAISRSDGETIRVGISPLTPSAPFERLLAHVHQKNPRLSIRVIPFSNGPEAISTLPELGRQMDVVLGPFDERYLKEHDCAGLELERQSLMCAVPPALQLEEGTIGLPDLEGHGIMLIRQGWNESFDRLREAIQLNYPSIRIVDFPYFDTQVFNRCVQEGLALAALPLWKDVHPQMRTVPTDWDLWTSVGMLYSRTPSERVQEFVDLLQSAAEQRRSGSMQ